MRLEVKKKYEIEVLGMPLTVQTTETEQALHENVKELEARVNELIYQNARITKGQAMLFLALNYLSEIEALKQENAKLKAKQRTK